MVKNPKLLNRNNAAVYCRLSVDDGSNQESQSIANQKSILTKYVIDQGWNLFNVYIDDGYSGTNFDRPDFKRLITDIECGLIDIVITKDLSRLGRDYLETGRYTEKYFPDHDVRYIALNDNVDTAKELDDFIPFKNIINEWYAKDISKKVRFTVRNQMIKGEFKKTGYPLYGYMYDNENRRIPNPDTAPNVVKIFEMFNKGYSMLSIRDYLEENLIKTPMGYYVEKHPDSVLKKKITNVYNWTQDVIMNILKNREYLGHYIRGKTTKRFKSKIIKFVPVEDQYVFENVFEPLISQETFDFAQTMFCQNRQNGAFKNPFMGITFCGICGKPLRHITHKDEYGIKEERLACPSTFELGKGSIILDDLKEVMRREILDLQEVISAHEDEFYMLAMNKIENAKNKNILSQEEIKKRKIQARCTQLDKFIKDLFEKNMDNPMPENTYERMMSEYVSEKRLLEAELKRQELVEPEEEIKLEEFKKQYKAFVNAIKRANDNNLFTTFTIRNIVSKIVITTFKLEKTPHNELGKNITIVYKFADGFVKEFIKEKRGYKDDTTI